MKKMYTLAASLLLATSGPALAQGTELFLSEYDEGAHPNASGGMPCPNATTSTGNEKVLEIYNPTTSTVNLDVYSVRRYSNGSMTETEDERMKYSAGPNQMPPSEAFVMAHPEVSLTQILTVVDQLTSPRASGPNATVIVGGGPIQFNGNDAVALVRWSGPVAGQGTPMIVDLIGVIGNDPGTQWSGADPNSGEFVRTANQSLRRRPNISSGAAAVVWNMNTNPTLDPTLYNPADEWEMYSTAFPGGVADPCSQSYADLGTHTYTGPHGQYSPTGLLEEFHNAIQFYPNPATDKVRISLGDAKVGQLLIINGQGRSIAVRPGLAGEVTVDVSSLAAGLYFVRCTSADGKLTVYKELMVQ